MAALQESDLYPPIKHFLEAQGFAVRGEVGECDLIAIRENEMIVVELKPAFNLALLLQGVDRQRMADQVYLAVQAPKSARGRWRDQLGLCRRLGLGLLTVRFGGRRARVEVQCEPEPYVPRRDLKKRNRLLREFQGRSGDHNPGGSTRKGLVTAYREQALRAARFLQAHGPSSPRSLRSGTGNEKAHQLLYRNVYGWFERVSRGLYGLTESGERALEQYQDVLAGMDWARWGRLAGQEPEQ